MRRFICIKDQRSDCINERMHNAPILIADIGGTNARFALADDSTQHFSSTQTLQAVEFEKLTDAIDTYLSAHSIKQVKAMCLAAAGPIINGGVKFPNSHWQVDSLDLKAKYNIEHAYLLNDWEAIAYSLTKLTGADLKNIGGEWQTIATESFTVAALGPGSGLGSSGLINTKGSLTPIIAEGGHVGFAPENKQQVDILNYLHKKFDDRISRERLLSGPGIVNIHEALCEINNVENPGLSAADIARAFINDDDLLCQQTFDVFFEILGQVAGDCALALGAYQGIFIGGGICQRYPDKLATSLFRKGFENKGRHKGVMRSIPTWLITHPNPGLLGASVYAKAKLT